MTNTSAQDRAHQGQSARRWHESIILAQPQALGDQESPKHSQGTGTEHSWQPDILKTSVDRVGFHLGQGSVCSVSALPISQICTSEEKNRHPPRREPSSCQHSTARRSPCPGNPHLKKGSQTSRMCQHLITAGVQFKSFSLGRVFCFQKHTLRKKITVQDFYPSKITIMLQPSYYN